jgi:hypothetical protein
VTKPQFLARLYLRLPPHSQHVNIQIVKVADMTSANLPVRPTTPILCPRCLRRTVYDWQALWYLCPVHGVVLRDEDLFHYLEDALR